MGWKIHGLQELWELFLEVCSRLTRTWSSNNLIYVHGHPVAFRLGAQISTGQLNWETARTSHSGNKIGQLEFMI